MFTSSLETLKDCKQCAPWKGRVPSHWFNHLRMDFEIERLESSVLNRKDLFEICDDPTRSALECVASICAWGGMKVGHGKALFETRSAWLPIVEDLRTVKYSRLQTYSMFSQLREERKLPGCGPAYFTKFIFFLSCGQPGYIMDQWTGKSIQLLTGTTRPILTKSGYVADENTGQEYDGFCRTIELLAQELNVSPRETEEKIFSVGGKNAGQWRCYVRKNWRNLNYSSNPENSSE